MGIGVAAMGLKVLLHLLGDAGDRSSGGAHTGGYLCSAHGVVCTSSQGGQQGQAPRMRHVLDPNGAIGKSPVVIRAGWNGAPGRDKDIPYIAVAVSEYVNGIIGWRGGGMEAEQRAE